MKILTEPLIYSSIKQKSSYSSRLQCIRDCSRDVTDDYLEFGQDYYDNPDVPQGFGGYKYDGRYAACAKQIHALIPFQNILDFGCAKGYLLYEFYKLSKNVIGIDISNYARQNAKREIKPFLYQNVFNLPDKKLSDIEVIVTRDVLPHLEQDELTELFKFLEKNCPKLKLFYIEIIISSSQNSRKALFDWDPTHKLIESVESWNLFFKQFNMPISVYYKNLSLE